MLIKDARSFGSVPWHRFVEGNGEWFEIARSEQFEYEVGFHAKAKYSRWRVNAQGVATFHVRNTEERRTPSGSVVQVYVDGKATQTRHPSVASLQFTSGATYSLTNLPVPGAPAPRNGELALVALGYKFVDPYRVDIDQLEPDVLMLGSPVTGTSWILSKTPNMTRRDYFDAAAYVTRDGGFQYPAVLTGPNELQADPPVPIYVGPAAPVIMPEYVIRPEDRDWLIREQRRVPASKQTRMTSYY